MPERVDYFLPGLVVGRCMWVCGISSSFGCLAEIFMTLESSYVVAACEQRVGPCNCP